jgi:hypothetical protein
MIRQHSELSQCAGGGHFVDFLVENESTWCYHSDSDFISHLLDLDCLEYWALLHCFAIAVLLCRHFLRLLDNLLDRPDHVEGLFRNVVVFPIDDFSEPADRVL